MKIDIKELIADREAGTSGPWALGGWDEAGGYDCMTGGISAGPVRLDGALYGEQLCVYNGPPNKIVNDARRISRLPDLEDALLEAVEALELIAKIGPSSAGSFIALRGHGLWHPGCRRYTINAPSIATATL